MDETFTVFLFLLFFFLILLTKDSNYETMKSILFNSY